MKLIAEKRSQTDKYDVLRFVRNNGSGADTLMPRQAILPRGLLHYVVESALPLRNGVLSLLARGADVADIMEVARDPADRTAEQDAVQAEAIVEGLQTQLRAGDFNQDAFLAGAALACAARDQTPFDFAPFDVKSCLYDRALALHRQWSAVPYFSTLSLEFHPRLA